MKQRLYKPEILAPAGSMEALKAAVYAGADAVYLGGSRFGARAYADNFDEPALIEAIAYCHIYGVKVYLTINTLFRNEETAKLYDYLKPLYEAGLDAVIVQDLGVVKYVHQYFPDIPIHASTQMMITTKYAYTILKEYGVKRIIPARELSIEEIADLKSTGCPEIEVFVQGALCYCYSGACLMSSMIGGRSGNRGRCAQTCRLPYQAYDGKEAVKAEGSYLLSPKDLCGLEVLGDLAAAGVDSFKIEGRMKRPEYVAVCVRAYREVLDAYYSGEDITSLAAVHKQAMAEVFNRGGFTNGYFRKHNGKDMMSIREPGHKGVEIGRITEISRNRIRISLTKNVYRGDILTVKEATLTCNAEERTGKEILLNAPGTKNMKKGQKVFRMYQAPLMQELSSYGEKELPIFLKGFVKMIVGYTAELTLTASVRGEEFLVTARGEMVEAAQAKPLTADMIRQKLSQTGNTRYKIEPITLEMTEEVFYSLKALKDLRRQALSLLEEEILKKSRRTCPETGTEEEQENREKQEKPSVMKTGRYVAAVSSQEQYEAVCASSLFSEIYMDLQYFSIEEIIKALKEKRRTAHYVMLPAVMRQREYAEIQALLEQTGNLNLPPAGFIVRNLDEFAYLKSIAYQGRIIVDADLYAMNDYAVQMIREVFPEAVITMPLELNSGQLAKLINRTGNVQVMGYGYQRLMVSAQCLKKNLTGCDRSGKWLTVKDRYNKDFFVKCICKYCCNLIYNGVPTVLYDVMGHMAEEVDFRIHFTLENNEDVQKVMMSLRHKQAPEGEITRGHLRRGVE